MIDLVKNKRIIIYGVGNTGKLFFEKYGEELSLEYCTSTDDEFEPIKGMKSIALSDLDKENDYLVICSKFYKDIYDWLLFLGWEVVRDFIRWDVFQETYAEKEKKYLTVFCGQCEMDEIVTCMRQDSNFTSVWASVVYNDREILKGGDLFNVGIARESSYILGYADCFVQGSAISPTLSSGYSNLTHKLREKARVIKVSLFDFDSYWPQDISSNRTLSPFYLPPQDKKIGAYCERDRFLEGLICDGIYTPAEILKKVCDKKCFERDVVWDNHKRTMMRVKIMDRVSDVKMFDYVDGQFDKSKLFCDRGHFNTSMMQEYAIRLLRLFQESVDEDAIRCIDMDNTFYGVNEFPIYPSTASILELEWNNNDTLYRMYGYNGLKRVTFKEYMECLIKYYSETKIIIDEL